MSSTGGGSHKSSDGVPRWNGEAGSFQEFEEQCLVYEQSVEYHKRYMVAPRVIAELQGTAKKVIAGRPATWVSYHGGLRELLDTLRASLGKPQVSEIADYLNKYFRGSRRRPGEAMGDYIVKKTEAYLRAQQALKRVLDSKGRRTSAERQPESGATASRRSSWTWTADGASEADDAGAEEPAGDTEGEPRTSSGAPTTTGSTWTWDDWRSSSWSQWSSYSYGQSYWSGGPSWQAYSSRDTSGGQGDLTEILPDFVQGWFLLNDAGLTPAERNMVHTAVQGDYGVQRIAQELRNQWDEASLRRKEGLGKAQMGFWGDEADGEFQEEELEEQNFNVDELNLEGQALYSEAEDVAQSALVALDKARRTLRDARTKQHQVKMSRQYYKTSSSSWRPGTSASGSGRPSPAGTSDDSHMTCLKCGKVGHRAANCPQKVQQAQVATEEQTTESAPFICYSEMALSALDTENLMSTQEAVKKGYGVLDGGATRTLGSVQAIQSVLDINQSLHGSTRLKGVNTDQRPVFSFGNSSEAKCASTVALGIDAGKKAGQLVVHALDEGEGPILLSVATLRSLGAIIDFAQDLAVFRALDDSQIVPLQRSKTGHQLIPLTTNLFSGAKAATRAVPSLADFLR